jgi:hypothetical protein
MNMPSACTSAEPRPTTATKEMHFAAAERTVDLLIKNRHLTQAERDGSIESLAKASDRHLDGYQLAKRLDDWHHWDCNLAMAEDLDNFSRYLEDELRKAELAWFERTNPAPPFPDGARIAFGRNKTGTIDRIFEYGPAKYSVKVDGDPEADTEARRRSILNFEDVRAA